MADVAQGKSNLAIARQYDLTLRAVEKHVSEIFGRLGLANDESDQPARAGHAAVPRPAPEMSPRLRNALLLGAPGLALVAAAVTVILEAPNADRVLNAVVAAIGLLLVWSVAVALRLRYPERPLGPLLFLLAGAYAIQTLLASPNPYLFTLARAARPAVEVLLIWVMLAFPSGRLQGRAERALVLSKRARGDPALAARFDAVAGHRLARPVRPMRAGLSAQRAVRGRLAGAVAGLEHEPSGWSAGSSWWPPAACCSCACAAPRRCCGVPWRRCCWHRLRARWLSPIS